MNTENFGFQAQIFCVAELTANPKYKFKSDSELVLRRKAEKNS